MKRITNRVVFATLILAVAIASGAFAAGQITGRSIKDGTITGKDVKNHSLTATDFKGSVRGPQGPQGPQGPAGPQGPQGPAGPSAVSGLATVTGSLTVPAGQFDGGTVFCPSGQRVVSGGYTSDTGFVFASAPNEGRTGWVVAMDNTDYAVDGTLTGYAVCAGAGQAVAARAHPQQLRHTRAVDRLLARHAAALGR